MFVDRKYVRKSTKCIEEQDAIEFAKEFYDTIRINQRLNINVHSDTFNACAQCPSSGISGQIVAWHKQE
ncbi:MAG: hypothetical protein ACR2OR_04490, partial [Hyphomicrobiales bacterium]